ncbi:MAG: efflux RND transporter periplasmic adaptor subunit [Candidatus Rokubacteria bacterium]|nr:efflux RND transporter periplasmic adaptor subunit [Candidatus Rokubacteria bacterium]
MPLAHGAELDCLIEPYVVVNVSAPVDGLVERVEVDRGDVVEEGQVLAVLESSVQQATLAIARARAEMDTSIEAGKVRLDYSIRKVANNEKLLQEGGISEREVDEARAQRDLNVIAIVEAQENKRLAELDMKRAEAELGIRTIRSPINGVVMERLLSAMEQMKQTPIVKLAQLDPLRVEVFAPIALLGKIAVGMTVQVRPEAPVGGAYPARVTVVDRVVDAASGTFGVRLELPNPGNRLPAGLKCRIVFSQ